MYMISRIKKSRFRITGTERNQIIDVLTRYISETVTTTEDEMWKNIREELCKDTLRFHGCSIRLLRGHMNEQVKKFKKCLSNEATEEDMLRLNTPWAEKMNKLMDVWPNYEALVTDELIRKSYKSQLGWKGSSIVKPRSGPELDAADSACHAVLQLEDHSNVDDDDSIEIENVVSPRMVFSTSSFSQQSPNPEKGETTIIRKRKQPPSSEIMEFLKEKHRIEERQLALEERKFVLEKLKVEEEFDIRKRQLKVEEIKAESNLEREKIITQLLLKLLNNSHVREAINKIQLQ